MPYYKTFFGDTFIEVEASSEEEAEQQGKLMLLKEIEEMKSPITCWEITEEGYKENDEL